MIIDVNAWVGHWPFRQLRHNTVQGLLRLMDRSGIDRAVVASVHGVFYRNAHSANEELAKQVLRHRDRLIPFATLNPTYAEWGEDLRRCAEDLELCGIRLVPQYHGYDLDSDASLDLLDAVSDLGWCVQVPMRIVDRRQRHPWDMADDLKPAMFRRFLNLRPHIRWMILNGAGFTGRILPPDVPLPGGHFPPDRRPGAQYSGSDTGVGYRAPGLRFGNAVQRARARYTEITDSGRVRGGQGSHRLAQRRRDAAVRALSRKHGCTG